MSVAVSIAGVSQSIREGSYRELNALSQRDTCQFTVLNADGTLVVQDMSQVSVTGDVAFAGFVFSSEKSNLYPNTNNDLIITCMDNKYLADKHVNSDAKERTNEYAGNIAVELVHDYLAQEGVTANYALDRDTTAADFHAGTRVNTDGYSNAGDGDLELTTAGSEAAFGQASQADFEAGSLLNTISPLGGGLTLANSQAIKMTATQSTPGVGNAWIYVQFWTGAVTIAAGDQLFYDVWIPDSCPSGEQKAGVDFTLTDGQTLRNGINIGGDDQGVGAWTGHDLSGLATNQWYTRHLFIDNGGLWTGKTIAFAMLVFEGDAVGDYAAYVRNVYVTDNVGAVKSTWFALTDTQTQTPPTDIGHVGYSALTVTVVNAYEKHGSAYSPTFSLSSAGIVRQSLLSWRATLPSSDLSVIVSASVDADATTYLPATPFAPIPGLIPGMNTSGVSAVIEYSLANNGNDPTLTPFLVSMTGVVSPSSTSSKSDITRLYDDPTSWAAGSAVLQDVNFGGDNPNALQLAGAARNWDDANTINQVQFGDGFVSGAVLQKGYALTVSGGHDGASQLLFAGQYQNFTLECDVLVQGSSIFTGLRYRTTGWQNNKNSFAWLVDVSTTAVNLGYGFNSSSGTGSYTNVGTKAVTLSANEWHRLKVIANGTSHSVYLDNVLVIGPITDSHYNISGYVGLNFHNPTGGTQVGQFDNFGIAQALSGTWVSGAINLSALGITSGSLLNCMADPANVQGNTSVLTEISLDNGATWATCTNGATVPGLTSGTDVSSITAAKLRVTITATTAATGAQMPDVLGLFFLVLGHFNATGTRVSPVLSLTPVGRLGSSLVAWNAIVPSGTTLGVDTSPNGSTWTDVSGSNGGPIPGYTAQPDPFLDNFAVDDHANYTTSSFAGGSSGSWTFDLTNRRLVAASGINGVDVYTTMSFKDGYVECILDQADSAGIGWRWSDGNNSYFLRIYDDQGVSAQQVLRLMKRYTGTNSQIGSDVAIVFKRGTYHAFHVEMVGTAISVLMDGVQLISTTDSSLAGPGNAYLYNNGSGRFENFRVQPYGDDMTGKNVYTRQRLASTDPTVGPQVLDLTVMAQNPAIGVGALIPSTAYSLYTGNITSIAGCFDDLASKSLAPTPYYWDIGDDKGFVFRARSATPAPFPVATANGDVLLAGLSVSTASATYRNDQWIIGGFDTVTTVEHFIGDGYTQTWTLGNPIAASSSASPAPLITVTTGGGPPISKTVGVRGIDSGKDFYYQLGSNEITQDAAASPLTGNPNDTTDPKNQVLTVTASETIPVFSHSSDPVEQAVLAAIEGGSGIVTVVESAPGLSKAASDALAVARRVANQVRGRTFNCGTRHAGLASGMLINVFAPELGLINAVCLIASVATTMTTGAVITPWYQAVLIEGPLVDSWSRMMAKAMVK